MGLRWKVALALAAVALVATTAVGIIGYRSTSARLIDEVDRSLNEAVALVATRPNNRVPTRTLLSVYSVRVLDRRGDLDLGRRAGRQRLLPGRAEQPTPGRRARHGQLELGDPGRADAVLPAGDGHGVCGRVKGESSTRPRAARARP